MTDDTTLQNYKNLQTLKAINTTILPSNLCSGLNNLTTVITDPNKLKFIGESCFQNTNLNSETINDFINNSNLVISNNVFNGLNTNNITQTNKMKSYGNGIFTNISVNKIIFNEPIINTNTFYNGKINTFVGNNIINISEQAFYDCNFENIYINSQPISEDNSCIINSNNNLFIQNSAFNNTTYNNVVIKNTDNINLYTGVSSIDNLYIETDNALYTDVFNNIAINTLILFTSSNIYIDYTNAITMNISGINYINTGSNIENSITQNVYIFGKLSDNLFSNFTGLQYVYINTSNIFTAFRSENPDITTELIINNDDTISELLPNALENRPLHNNNFENGGSLTQVQTLNSNCLYGTGTIDLINCPNIENIYENAYNGTEFDTGYILNTNNLKILESNAFNNIKYTNNTSIKIKTNVLYNLYSEQLNYNYNNINLSNLYIEYTGTNPESSIELNSEYSPTSSLNIIGYNNVSLVNYSDLDNINLFNVNTLNISSNDIKYIDMDHEKFDQDISFYNYNPTLYNVKNDKRISVYNSTDLISLYINSTNLVYDLSFFDINNAIFNINNTDNTIKLYDNTNNNVVINGNNNNLTISYNNSSDYSNYLFVNIDELNVLLDTNNLSTEINYEMKIKLNNINLIKLYNYTEPLNNYSLFEFDQNPDDFNVQLPDIQSTTSQQINAYDIGIWEITYNNLVAIYTIENCRDKIVCQLDDLFISLYDLLYNSTYNGLWNKMLFDRKISITLGTNEYEFEYNGTTEHTLTILFTTITYIEPIESIIDNILRIFNATYSYSLNSDKEPMIYYITANVKDQKLIPTSANGINSETILNFVKND